MPTPQSLWRFTRSGTPIRLLEIQQAQEHYGEKKDLEDQAKEMKSKLPPI
jgi:hypothetical protein